MEQNFERALIWLRNHEGGVTNHPESDRGGLTNLGVTHEEYDRYRRLKGLPLRSVTLIEDDEVRDIYHTFYWKVIQGPLLPSGIDNVIFDMAVNNGVVGAAKAAQRVANKLTGKSIAVDGHLGPISCDVIDDCHEVAFIDAFCDERLRVDRTFWNWGPNGLGWTNRVNGNPRDKHNLLGVRGESKSIIDPVAKNPKPQVPAQAIEHVSFYERLVSFLANYFRRR
jgi:lysozyme family protein